MPMHAAGARTLLNEVLLGAGLGLVVLGVGGRAVMRGIALVTDAPSAVSVGGTVSVLAAGAAAGAAGALLHALARAAAAWGAGGRSSVRLVLFAALLALVTARGLHGSPPGPAAAFWPLVLVYAGSLVRVLARRARQAGSGSSAPPVTAPPRLV
jgi:hypothetical protein